MAQKVSIILVDDLTGEEGATQTVAFGLDGSDYEIDLTDDNASALREAVAQYVGAARKVSGRGRGTRKASTASSSSDTAAIREWAKAQGMDVSERGRIPAEVQQAYAARDTSPSALEAPKGRVSRRRTTTVEAIEASKEPISA